MHFCQAFHLVALFAVFFVVKTHKGSKKTIPNEHDKQHL